MRTFGIWVFGILAILLWVATIAMGAFGLLGRTTADHYYNQLGERLPALASWLLATQWWVPGGWAWALTVFVLWASWPADQTN